MDINVQGLIIGLSTFLIIGLFHPLVIKGEYYFGLKIKWAFLIVGMISLGLSLFSSSLLWSGLLAVVAFSCFWSIKEVYDQKKRVEKGWFPMNPKRKSEYKINNEHKKREACAFHNGQTSLTNISITEET